MSSPMPPKIAAAVAKITGEIGAVAKRGKNDFHRYEYATAADILHKAQPLFAEHGLIITPFQVGMDFIADGGALSLTFEFCLSHESGETWDERPRFSGMAAARNSKGGFDDKCANKCLTGAQKYFLLALFKIPTGDYPDADAEEDKPPVKATAKPAAQPAPAVEPLPVDSPHMIKVPLSKDGESPDWREWAMTFAATIRACPTADDVQAWVEANTAPLKNFKAAAPKMAANLEKAISECLTQAPSKEAA